MAYALTNMESVGSGIARILQEEITAALQQLSSKEDNSTTQIHECRKHLKKSRSMVRMIKSGIALDIRRNMMSVLRTGAQELSPLREMDAHLECLMTVRKELKEQSTKRALRTVQQHLATGSVQQQGYLPDAFEKASTAIALAQNQIHTWDFQTITLDVIAKGISRSYRDARRIYQSIDQQSAPTTLHEWRKRIKDLRYQSAIITNVWPTMILPLEATLHTLTDHLGLVHDLSLLIEMLEKGMWPSINDRTRAKALICTAQRYQQEQAAAFQLGARLFAEKPNCFRKRFTRYLEVWKTER